MTDLYVHVCVSLHLCDTLAVRRKLGTDEMSKVKSTKQDGTSILMGYAASFLTRYIFSEDCSDSINCYSHMLLLLMFARKKLLPTK